MADETSYEPSRQAEARSLISAITSTSGASPIRSLRPIRRYSLALKRRRASWSDAISSTPLRELLKSSVFSLRVVVLERLSSAISHLRNSGFLIAIFVRKQLPPKSVQIAGSLSFSNNPFLSNSSGRDETNLSRLLSAMSESGEAIASRISGSSIALKQPQFIRIEILARLFPGSLKPSWIRNSLASSFFSDLTDSISCLIFSVMVKVALPLIEFICSIAPA